MTYIQLPLLHSLSLTILSQFTDLSWSILRYIMAPSVHLVYLGGPLQGWHIFEGASELGKHMCPKKLTLESIRNEHFSWYSMRNLEYNYNLAGVEYLTVSLQAPGEYLGGGFPWWEELHSVLVSMPCLALFDLRFRGDLACFQDIIGSVSCDLHVYCQSLFKGKQVQAGHPGLEKIQAL